MLPEWETIIPLKNYNSTERLQVPGGWLVCRIDGGKSPAGMTMCFVADPNHEWRIE